jgi:hypothetical protein|tara:strand:+ start:2201 stop:3028 length:828 start_codon:yes stop_codon:yes gene_type:complete
MADLHQVQINEVNEEENISLESQAAMQEEAAQQRNQTLEADPKEGKETIEEQLKVDEVPEEERPEWLDEKFDNPEDMAKAYKELQKKMSEPKADKKAAKKSVEEPAGAEVTTGAIESARNEFSESGELSDSTFDALEAAGLPRAFVEQYINGQEAMSIQQASSIQESIGGAGNYEAMAEWASENMADGDLDAFNAIVEGPSVEQARITVKGMYAQFQAAGGKGPALVQGSTSGDSGVKPFGSTAQVTEAMRDPRYASDPAYRENVEKRMSVSSIF